ncbi:Fe-S cluster assembly transcriptional regulator IscR [Permianibacter sp. IMCC34836]|uniref:Fe-S cluster assembly transcriptional regulator IscR n=1 Tax=Permianibacter fluminis TaxID=2738515 RepID=UPI001557344E|nr:Fe-S cluster assembly transcriptional regulator IscR [Permianibacter fluminis]NQD38136.1 Fe-S cluster assembly transcriptional regulator IscR [Permianibacter fluminis]
MKLSTKGRYAVTAMLDLALHHDEGPVALAEVSARQGISLSYLEQLFAQLRREGLVTSVRGPGGGYRLGRSADAINVAEVITAVNENIDATRCGGTGTCDEGEECLTHRLWLDLSNQIYNFLSGISLAQVVARREVQHIAERQHRRDAKSDNARIDSARLIAIELEESTPAVAKRGVASGV